MHEKGISESACTVGDEEYQQSREISLNKTTNITLYQNGGWLNYGMFSEIYLPHVNT